MIQLKVRTEYSFGQTYAPIPRVIERLKAIGCTAAGIVDSDTWGHAKWQAACDDAGITPLFGVECVVTNDEAPMRMWFLARNLTELYGWVSKSYHQRLQTRVGAIPRLYRHDVEKMSEAIIKFAGEITDGEWLASLDAVMDISPASQILNMKKRAIAQQYQLRLVETSDNAFAYPEDRSTFELMSRSSLKPSAQYLLEHLGHQAHAKAVASLCNDTRMPTATMLKTEGDLLALCKKGAKFRGVKLTGKYLARLKHEMNLIQMKEFESYFLIVADMVQYAKQHMLVGPSRGSAAGSLVCYLTRITEIDPIHHNLMFERFIDETRKDLPDIDLDFPDDKRHLVFEYMAKKYGEENVAHIGTVSRFKPKSALIQVCKALHIPPDATGAVKAALIERSSADARASKCLEDTFANTKPGKDFMRDYPEAKVAAILEGHASHTGVHAAGLLVCNAPIANFAVVDDEGIAHLEKDAAEKLGLLKIDILGLRTLSILEDAGKNIDWYNLPLDDQKTIDLFNTGRLCGIFQFEGGSMRTTTARMKIKSIIDIDAITALSRPGPYSGGVTKKYLDRSNGLSYTAIHPLVEKHMSETFGLPIYQEQTLVIVKEIGGFGGKESAMIRKAISKSMGVEFFNSYWERFKAGAATHGVDEVEAKSVWQLIMTMGSWQMNKSHTRSYAVISYWCAYLKAHYPLDFAAANLRNAKDEDNAVLLLREMTREGIEYVPFDLDKSEINWSVKDGKLYGGFLALKGIGEAKAQKLIAARDNGTLTPAQRETIAKSFNIFADLFPLQTKYRTLYADPDANGIQGPISYISELQEPLPHGAERVFIGELVIKNPRNANEEANIKKRDGVIATGQLEYFDFRLRDDTGQLGCRIGIRDYLQIGVELAENVPIGAHLIVRAKFWNGIPYGFVYKWRRLDGTA